MSVVRKVIRTVPLRGAGTPKRGEGADATLCTRRHPTAGARPFLFFTRRIKQTFANK
jgi:hypothetical protein